MKSLDKLTNMAILLVCIVVIADMIYRDMSSAPLRAPTSTARLEPFRRGEAFPRMTGLRQESGKSSLLLVVKSSCKYCKDSIPFYQRLVNEIRSTNAAVQLVGLCLESDTACANYFSETQVPVDVTLGAPNGLPRIQRTPTIVMLDPNGNVAEIWVGALGEDGQKAVLTAITKRS